MLANAKYGRNSFYFPTLLVKPVLKLSNVLMNEFPRLRRRERGRTNLKQPDHRNRVAAGLVVALKLRVRGAVLAAL